MTIEVKMKITIDKQENEKYEVNFELTEHETTDQAKAFNGINIAITRLLQEILVRTCPNKASAIAVLDAIINNVADTLIDYIQNDFKELNTIEEYASQLIQNIFCDWLKEVALFDSEDEFAEYYKDKKLNFDYKILDKLIVICLSENNKPVQLIMNIETKLLDNDEKHFDVLCSQAYIIASAALNCLYGEDSNPLNYKEENSMENVIQRIKSDTKNLK